MRDRLWAAEKVKAIDWRGEALYLLDQRSLPFDETWLACTGAQEVARAIREMVVCGAPAIGIAAAYGVVLAARVRRPQAAIGWRRWRKISHCWRTHSPLQ